jgi:hypothetical protein
MATALASMLDMQIRVAMSKENPLAVNFPEPNTLFNVTGTNKKIMIEKLQETADQIRRTAVPDDLLTFPGITAFLNLPEGAERQLIVARARTQIPKLAQESFLTRIQFVVNGLSRRTD